MMNDKVLKMVLAKNKSKECIVSTVGNVQKSLTSDISGAKWYERVTQDPQGSLERLAHHKGISIQELEERHGKLSQEFMGAALSEFAPEQEVSYGDG